MTRCSGRTSFSACTWLLLLLAVSFAARAGAGEKSGLLAKAAAWVYSDSQLAPGMRVTNSLIGDERHVKDTDMADTLTASGPGELIGAAADQTHSVVKNSSRMRDLVSSKRELLQESQALKAQKADLITQQRGVKKEAFKVFKEQKALNPKAGAIKAAEAADAKTGFRNRSTTNTTELRKVNSQIAQNRGQRWETNAKIAKTSSWGAWGKDMLQKGGTLLTIMDLTSAGARIAGEAYNAVYEGGSARSVLNRVAEEAFRIKTMAVAAATGAVIGAATGPAAPVAGPLMAMTCAVGAAEIYAQTAGASSDRARQSYADRDAHARYAADPDTQARLHAAAEARRAQEAMQRKLEHQAKGEEYQNSLRAMAALRSRVDEWRKRNRDFEAASRRDQELRGPYTLTQRAETKEVSTGAAVRVFVQIKGGKSPYQLSGAVAGSIVGPRIGWYDYTAPATPGRHVIKLVATDANGRSVAHKLDLAVTAVKAAEFERAWQAGEARCSVRVRGARVWLVLARTKQQMESYEVYAEQMEPVVEVRFHASTSHSDGGNSISLLSHGITPEGYTAPDGFVDQSATTDDEKPQVAHTWALRFPFRKKNDCVYSGVRAWHGQRHIGIEMNLVSRGHYDPQAPEELTRKRIVYQDPAAPRWEHLTPEKQGFIRKMNQIKRKAIRAGSDAVGNK